MIAIEELREEVRNVSDEEVSKRWDEMESGAVEGISMEELFNRIER